MKKVLVLVILWCAAGQVRAQSESTPQPACLAIADTPLALLEGIWTVDWSYRTAQGVFAESTASSRIEPDLLGCALTERFEGRLRGAEFEATSHFSRNASEQFDRVRIDSEHGSFSQSSGRIAGDSLVFEAQRDLGNRVLRTRHYFFGMERTSFSSEFYMSPAEGQPWELVERSAYRRFSASGLAQPAALNIGDTFTLHSQVLDETRTINVYAPAGYQESDTLRLPVLYMPDGGIKEDFLHVAGLVQISSLNWTMRPHLLVGIENTERRRDLTGPTTVDSDREIAPRVGGSAAFRTFLRDELMPVINSTYRTTGETSIVGESLAGLFVVETLLLEPDLFGTYVAIDPSLWWDGERLADTAVTALSEPPSLKATLYLATSEQPDIARITERMAGDLRSAAPKGLTLHHAQYPAEYHWTIYHPAALTAFRAVFAREEETELMQEKPMSHTARGEFVVSLKPLTFEGVEAETQLGRMSIDKEISGDLAATTVGQMLTAMTATTGSAGYVAVEYVTGVLDGKRGSFALQHTGTMNRGAQSLTVTVVPDSGTGELEGLEGEFNIIIEDGNHLYEFTYRFAAQENR